MQVWEVTAQLIGLAGSVGLLKAIEATGKPENVLYVWAVNQARSCIRSPPLLATKFSVQERLLLQVHAADTRLQACKQYRRCRMIVMQVAHAWLRYKSLAVLQFDNINQKRACLLARASVSGQVLPGVVQSNLCSLCSMAT